MSCGCLNNAVFFFCKDGHFNPLPTNDAYMRHELPYAHINYMGGLILGVNTLYMLFCFFKLFPMVGKGLIHWHNCWEISYTVEGSTTESTGDEEWLWRHLKRIKRDWSARRQRDQENEHVDAVIATISCDLVPYVYLHSFPVRHSS